MVTLCCTVRGQTPLHCLLIIGKLCFHKPYDSHYGINAYHLQWKNVINLFGKHTMIKLDGKKCGLENLNITYVRNIRCNHGSLIDGTKRCIMLPCLANRSTGWNNFYFTDTHRHGLGFLMCMSRSNFLVHWCYTAFVGAPEGLMPITSPTQHPIPSVPEPWLQHYQDSW